MSFAWPALHNPLPCHYYSFMSCMSINKNIQMPHYYLIVISALSAPSPCDLFLTDSQISKEENALTVDTHQSSLEQFLILLADP